MSYIDAHQHTQHGLFIGLPLNQVHGTVTGEFDASPGDYVLGEGSGGPPAAVIPIASAVYAYLDDLLDDMRISDDEVFRHLLGVEELDALVTQLGAAHSTTAPEHEWSAPVLRAPEYYWAGDFWAEIVAAAQTWSVGQAYTPGPGTSINEYILRALGENALVTGTYQPAAGIDVVSFEAVRNFAAHSGRYRAVAATPPGYPPR